MDALLKNIEQICNQHQLHSLEDSIQSVKRFIENKLIDIVILGQFKAGKSSFINSFFGQDIVPTGVVPVTSVITRLQQAKTEKLLVYFHDKEIAEVELSKINTYVAEEENPKNEKNVSFVEIHSPLLNQFTGLRFVDTPGLGSAFRHNSITTYKWVPEAGVAIITISAERPLGENEIELITKISESTPEIIILLTKTDLFKKEEIHQIRSYINQRLQQSFKRDFRIFEYSSVSNTDSYKFAIINEIIEPLKFKFKGKREKIIKHKVISLADKCLSYLEIAFQASLKSDKEKEDLNNIIFGEKADTEFIRHELKLITDNSKSLTRDIVYGLLSKYEERITEELQSTFRDEYNDWNGNLYKVSRKYEEWMKRKLSGKLKEVVVKENSKFNEIVGKVYAHFSFFTHSFRDRLSDNIFKVLGSRLTNEKWKPDVKTLERPDISVYRAFDTPIDLLWFLFPMFLFKTVFRNYFLRQIPKEVNKNIYRLTSAINKTINDEISRGNLQTMKYLSAEIKTVETLLSSQKSRSSDIEKSITLLKGLISGQ